MKKVMNKRIYLSPPHMSADERDLLLAAFDSNWIAPLGPMVDQFEAAICEYTGAKHALALSSGTAGLHLALRLIGIEAGDEVFVSTLTFSASVNPILYEGGTPVFIDSERDSWNMDPKLLAAALADRAAKGKLPKAVIPVHLYGQSANMREIMQLCNSYGVPVIEDAAESLGGLFDEQHTGTFGKAGIFSFNGNKIITTSGGGMLVSDDGDFIAHARKISTQAREPAPHYQHAEIGFNYRMSNLLAAVGCGQLNVIEERVAKRRVNFDYYYQQLSHMPGISFMPEANWGRTNRWLTVLTIAPNQSGVNREQVRLALEAENIEARPVWKPMHLQPVFESYDYFGGNTSEQLFRDGLCLPSGSSLSRTDQDRIISEVIKLYRN